jgi:predicted DNA-binding transcriptional regulator AlpA
MPEWVNGDSNCFRLTTITVEEVAQQLGVQPSTLYRHIPGGRSSLSLPM